MLICLHPLSVFQKCITALAVCALPYEGSQSPESFSSEAGAKLILDEDPEPGTIVTFEETDPEDAVLSSGTEAAADAEDAGDAGVSEDSGDTGVEFGASFSQTSD